MNETKNVIRKCHKWNYKSQELKIPDRAAAEAG